MPEFSQILASTWDAAAKTVDESERRHLMAHVAALKAAAGTADQEVYDELERAIGQGWLPDYHGASELVVTASLALSTARENVVGVNGEVSLGPLKLAGSLSSTFRQATTTNVTVEYRAVRRSASQEIEHALQSLGLVR